MTTLEQSLRLEQDGSVLTITLHRPDVLNALDDALLDRLAAALRMAEQAEDVRAIILTGAGRAFSSGQDVAALRPVGHDREAHGRAVGLHFRQRYNPIILRLRTIEKPVIAAVNGVAAGAGMGIALACDLRLASTNASFVAAAIKMGLIPALGITALLPALVGFGRALEIAFTGQRLGAAAAVEIGLINRVLPPAELMPAAVDLAQTLAALPPRTLGLAKRAFNEAVLPDLAARLAAEAALQEQSASTDDHGEAIAAFLEKRPPRFVGR